MSSGMASEYRFGRWRVCPRERQLLDDERPRKLGSRAFDTLLVLLENRERAVSKAELLERVWPRLVVEENNLQVQVAALRKLLGAATIVTIPGCGYRFAAPAEVLPGPPLASAPDVPAIAAEPPRHHNLPERLAALYGRDGDVAAVDALLEQHAVVSIVGAGGIGKTRLAEAVAHARRHAFANGTWIVELAPLADARLVPAEVARILGFDHAVDEEAVARAIATRSLLLVLDNCEHLLAAVATLAEAIARGAPGARVLVTSQEPLHIAAEHVYRLDPLTVPAAAAADPGRFGAVQLFAERARAADPRFELNAATLAAVIEICQRLDGIPLALELAAARIPLLGVEGLRARLDERFQVLTAGSRLVLRRHQTLRAALDFSHGLLSDAERAVFRRLGVFSGTFSVEDAQHLCAGEAMDRWAVLDCLGALVDKSMIVAMGREAAERRLRLLETTRAYALEQLAEAGETAQVLALHAETVAARMRTAYDDQCALPYGQWIARYTPELDNVRAAVDWSFAHRPALAIELVGDALKVWHDLGLQPEALRLCAAARGHVTAATPPRAAGRLLYAEAMMCANTQPKRSRDAARAAVPLLRTAGDEVVLAFALARLASAGRAGAGKERCDALAELERLQRPHWQGTLAWLPVVARATVLRASGQFAEAYAAYERARELTRALGDLDGALRNEVNMGDVALLAGDLDRAIAIHGAAAAALAARPDQLFHAFALMGLVNALLLKGDLASAREPLARATPLILAYDLAFLYADTLALYAAQHGRLTACAQLLGFSVAARAAHGELGREGHQLEAERRARAVLDGLPAAQREAWMREGSTAGAAALYAAAQAPDARG